MIYRNFAIILIALVCTTATAVVGEKPAEQKSGEQASRPASVLPDAEIRKILVDRIDTYHQSVGMVVGVIEPTGRRIITYGSLEKGDPRPLTGDTVFEIGSLSKVFTALLLADMVQRGEVALADPAGKYLPAMVKMPERNGKAITLADLATHTSGLPPLPTNFSVENADDPYAGYTVDQLYAFLNSYRLTRDPGTQYQYSNLGAGLLGHLLAQRAGMDYETLVLKRIARPLGMTSTTITLTPEMKARFAAGHIPSLATTPPWNFSTLAGAGALRSTANDMLNFLAANLGYTKTPLADTMALMVKGPRRPTGAPNTEIALGWHVWTAHGKEIVWHNGGTGGFRSFAGYDPKARIGVVILSNTFTPAGADDIGRHLLDPESPLLSADSPLLKPVKEHKQITLEGKLLDRYAGVYELKPGFLLTFTREGDHLLAQATGQSQFAVFAETEHDFFAKIADVQFTFQSDLTNPEGPAGAVVLHQMGRDLAAKRVREGEARGK